MQIIGLVLVLIAIGVNMSNLAGSYTIVSVIIGLVGFAILIKERMKRDKM